MSTKSTAIIDCKCSHAAQDRIYGKGKRVGNLLSKDAKSSTSQYRCTSCGTVHTAKE